MAFSYDQLAVDLHERIVHDSQRASLATTVCVVLIVAVLFRSVRVGVLVLLPVAYGVLVTAGVLTLAGHRFGGMGFAAFPLIVGLGIDNGIHLVRRHLETPDKDVKRLLAASGAALIQTNLTTIVGFGALLSATIPPLAELGLIAAVGIALTLLASILLVPAILALAGTRLVGAASGRPGKAVGRERRPLSRRSVEAPDRRGFADSARRGSASDSPAVETVAARLRDRGLREVVLGIHQPLGAGQDPCQTRDVAQPHLRQPAPPLLVAPAGTARTAATSRSTARRSVGPASAAARAGGAGRSGSSP